MAGTALDRELKPAGLTRFALAQSEDDRAIRGLLRENPMRGAVSLTLEREPNYFHGMEMAAGEDQTIVAFCGSRLVCMGRCVRRDCWIDGRVQSAGYLAELRLDKESRGQFRILRDGYAFFNALQRDNPAHLYFTSIAADNDRARRLLERGAPKIPSYSYLAKLDTLVVAVPRRPRAVKLQIEQATPDQLPAVLQLLNSHARRHQLATVWTTEILRDLEYHGLPTRRFLLAFSGGEMVACGALWDQRSFRQTVIRGYTPALSAARPLINALGWPFGRPHLPRPGSVLAHAVLSPLAFERGAEAILPDFVEAAFPLAAQAGVEFLTLALPASDQRLAVLRRRFTIRTWRSRLYRVDWPERAAFDFQDQDAPLLPDVSLL